MEFMVLNSQTGFLRSLAHAEISLLLFFSLILPKRPAYQHPLDFMLCNHTLDMAHAMSTPSKQSDIHSVYQTQFFA
jgi:hypothetical protein